MKNIQRTIKTNGTDIVILDRVNGGYAIKQGPSYVLCTAGEAYRLASALRELTVGGTEATSATPARARMLRFPVGGSE